MKKTRNSVISILCILLFSFSSVVKVYAINKTTEENPKSKKVIFLTDGQGNISSGDGSENNPYLNINTALNNVDVGGTIKILGKINYSKYEEHPSLLPRPFIINKEVIFEGVNNNSVFMTRAPIQLGKDVTFKNIRMEFWASNELMPGVPDPGLPQTPIDEGINFRSGRSIYLAGNKLTLDNVDTRINTVSFQKDYRPYISGGTFIDEGTIGPKAILNVINPNDGTEFAGIYAGDYWKERTYPVELNINGKVLDNTIHTGGIINSFNGDVIINVYNKGKISMINTKNHIGNTDISLKENTWLQNIDFNGIRNLILESNSQANFKKGTKFNVDNITLKKNALLDLRNIDGNAIVNGDFIGDSNTSSNNDILGGVIFLQANQMLDIKGDVKGITRLNSYSNINKVPLKENYTYIKAKENATGDFEINPDFAQSDYKLEKNLSNSLRTTWTTIRKKAIFKEFRWNGNLDDNIINPEENKDYIYPIEFIDESNNTYIPFGEDWDDFSIELKKPDGTILDDNSIDFDLGVFLEYTGAVINIYNTSFSGKLTLTVAHKDGQTITKNIQIGKKTNSDPPIINGANDITIKIGEVDTFNNLEGITVSDDYDIIDPSEIKITGQIGKPLSGTNQDYILTYEVTDSDENVTTIERKVTVTNQKPEIHGISDVVICKGEGKDFDFEKGITAIDHEDGDITKNIIFPKVDLSALEIGKHELIYTVTDSDGNTSIFSRIFTVNPNMEVINPIQAELNQGKGGIMLSTAGKGLRFFASLINVDAADPATYYITTASNSTETPKFEVKSTVVKGDYSQLKTSIEFSELYKLDDDVNTKLYVKRVVKGQEPIYTELKSGDVNFTNPFNISDRNISISASKDENKIVQLAKSVSIKNTFNQGVSNIYWNETGMVVEGSPTNNGNSNDFNNAKVSMMFKDSKGEYIKEDGTNKNVEVRGIYKASKYKVIIPYDVLEKVKSFELRLIGENIQTTDVLTKGSVETFKTGLKNNKLYKLSVDKNNIINLVVKDMGECSGTLSNIKVTTDKGTGIRQFSINGDISIAEIDNVGSDAKYTIVAKKGEEILFEQVASNKNNNGFKANLSLSKLKAKLSKGDEVSLVLKVEYLGNTIEMDLNSTQTASATDKESNETFEMISKEGKAVITKNN